MANWGVKIYEDDVALDVRELFMKLNEQGKAIDEIETTIRSEFIDSSDDIANDIALLALCCVEIETGTLTQTTEHEALQIINDGVHIAKWAEIADEQEALERKQILNALQSTIEKYAGKPIDIAVQCGYDESDSIHGATNPNVFNKKVISIIRTIGYTLGCISLLVLVMYVLMRLAG